jgi:stage V sporulation protein B
MRCPWYSLPRKGSDALSSVKKNSFFGGAAILAVGIIIVKLIGLLYKIPLGNILSDGAFADFNTAYAVYSFLIVITTGGLPVALTKMVAENTSLNQHNQAKKVFRISMAVSCVLGVLSFLVMFLFPAQLANLMNNPKSYYSMIALALAVLFICPLSAYRGYSQGLSEMAPTAVSQIIEALCKLIFGLVLAIFLIRQYGDESLAAGGAIFGVSVGCVLGTGYMVIRYAFRKKDGSISQDIPEHSRAILKTLIKLAIPITLGSSVIAVVTLIDTSLVFGRLQDAAGYTEDAARAVKGVFDKALTISNLAPSFMVPLTASVVPAVSSARARKNQLAAARVSETALRTTVLLALPAGIGLFALGEPIISLIYHDTDTVLGGALLSMLGLSSIAVCLTLISNAILQAYGFVNLPMITTIIGCVLKIVMSYTLVGNGDINIKGAPIGTLVCYSTIALLNLFFIKQKIAASPNYIRVFVKPLIASLLMGAAAWALYGLLSSVIGQKLGVLAAIGVAGILYIILVIALRVISREDLMFMPKGEKIAKLLRIN